MSTSKTWRKSSTFWESFRHASSGIILAAGRDKNIRRQLVLTTIVCVLSIVLAIPLLNLSVVLLACGLVLCLEMINSALEAAEDALHPKYHDMIRISKDIAAGAVLMASIVAVGVALLIFGPVIWRMAF